MLNILTHQQLEDEKFTFHIFYKGLFIPALSTVGFTHVGHVGVEHQAKNQMGTSSPTAFHTEPVTMMDLQAGQDQNSTLQVLSLPISCSPGKVATFTMC